MARKVPMKINYIRVNPKTAIKEGKPCAEQMNALLSCWRLSGVDSPGCLQAAAALSACAAGMATARANPKLEPSVNFILNKIHASR